MEKVSDFRRLIAREQLLDDTSPAFLEAKFCDRSRNAHTVTPDAVHTGGATAKPAGNPRGAHPSGAPRQQTVPALTRRCPSHPSS
ncbi:protein of unknown function [Burkholderia multivorans]